MEIQKEWKGLSYLEYRPNDFDETKKYPVLIYLHGAGERGIKDFELLKYHGPIMEAENGLDLPFVIISPQCAPECTWFNYGERLIELSEHCQKTSYMDEKRIYLTGNSMGGFGSWFLACARPDIFAAVVPICGGGMPWNAYMLENVPVWAFHCEGDPSVEVYETEKMIAALRSCSKSEVKETIYPYQHHNAWTETYHNPVVYEWLLNKSK
jgi:predicted peptidase